MDLKDKNLVLLPKTPCEGDITIVRGPKQKRYGDARDNAAIILECSNICPFKYKNSAFYCAYCPFPISSPEFGPIRKHTENHENRLIALIKMNPGSAFEADVSDLMCKLCETSIDSISMLFDHLIEVHDKPLSRDYDAGVIPYLLSDGYMCAECGITFNLFWNLHTHMNEHYPNFVCKECNQTFISYFRLKGHLVTHSTKLTQLKCTKCGDVFFKKSDKRKHMLSMHNIYTYKCPYCTDKFMTFKERVTHLIEMHDKKIEYPCMNCEKVFKSASERASHNQYIHIRDRRHECTECGNMFITLKDLKHHMIKHGGDKKFQCQVCNKAFARKYTFTEHMRIHNNDRRFVCDVCGKMFIQKCSLKLHIQSHHSGGPSKRIKIDLQD